MVGLHLFLADAVIIGFASGGVDIDAQGFLPKRDQWAYSNAGPFFVSGGLDHAMLNLQVSNLV